jgi:acid stress chaperone HdeB
LIQIKAINPAPGYIVDGGIWRTADVGNPLGSMRKLMVGTTIISLLAGPAAAEDKMVVDMSKMTCRELTKLGFQDFAGITMWLSGYYNASVRNTVIDLDQFAQAAKTVKDFCQTSPQSTVMSATEQALGIKMPRKR